MVRAVVLVGFAPLVEVAWPALCLSWLCRADKVFLSQWCFRSLFPALVAEWTACTALGGCTALVTPGSAVALATLLNLKP